MSDVLGADPEKKKYFTAFVVLIDEDGNVVASSDLETSGIDVDHEATFGDMRRAAGEIVHDINAMQTAQQVVGAIAHQARVAAEQQAGTRIMQKLNERGSGLVVP